MSFKVIQGHRGRY